MPQASARQIRRSRSLIPYKVIPLMLASMGAAQAALVLREPFTCCQYFRFFVVQTIPFATLAAVGCGLLKGWERVPASLFSLGSIGFIISPRYTWTYPKR